MDRSEEIVDRMIADGLKIVREAIEEHKPAAIVAAYSSGDDSVVSTHFAMTNLDGCFVFNADTMIGLAPARGHLKKTCGKFGWELQIEQATPEGPPERMKVNRKMVPFDPRMLPAGKWTDGATAYEESVLNFGFLGKAQHAMAYHRLKERPICRLLKRFGASKSKKKAKVLIISGIRHDESAIRAGYKGATAEGGFGDVWCNPFYWNGRDAFELYRREFGLPRNPVKWKCGISGECCCGTFGSVAERVAYREVDPVFADYLDVLECRVKSLGFPWGWGESPPPEWIAKERIVRDAKRGQGFLFLADERVSIFQPMCVGCNGGRR